MACRGKVAVELQEQPQESKVIKVKFIDRQKRKCGWFLL